MIEICKDYDMANIKHKSPHKVAEEQDLKLRKMIYLYIIKQNKLSYGGSKNLIFLQDSDTKQKWSLFTNKKEEFTEKFTPLLKKPNIMKKNINIIFCEKSGKNKTLEENCTFFSKKLIFNFTSPGTQRKNDMV